MQRPVRPLVRVYLTLLMSRQFLVSTRKRSSQRPNGRKTQLEVSSTSSIGSIRFRVLFALHEIKCTKQKAGAQTKLDKCVCNNTTKKKIPPKENQMTLLLEGIFFFREPSKHIVNPPDGMAPMQQTTQMIVAPLNGNGAKSGARTLSCCSYASALLTRLVVVHLSLFS